MRVTTDRRATRRSLAAALALALAAVAVASGGAAGSRRDDADAPPARQLIPDYGGLFGGSLYPSLAALRRGWRTDFTKHTVPLTQFQNGGPGKDGIRSVDRPWLVPVAEVDFLASDEPVLEVTIGGEARAYPFGILVLHEIVNDTVAGVPAVVTFCPLCNTALAFVRRARGRTLMFGVSGNLRDSDLVMYDRATESWWQQFGGEALVGAFAGEELERVPARGVRWAEFRDEHPDGVVATTRAEFDLPYGENPYLGTLHPDQPSFFPTRNSGDRRLPPSERVVFVERGHSAIAVPFSVLERREHVTVDLAGERLLVSLSGRTADVRDDDGRIVPFSEPFWFAVAAFRPDVEIVDE